MRPRIEEQFEAIGQKTIQECERVRCDFDEFVEGLQSVYQAIADRWQGARDELEAMDEEE